MTEWSSRTRFLTAMARRTPDCIPRHLSFGLTPAQEAVFREKTSCDDPFDYFKVDVRWLSLELHGGTNFRAADSDFYLLGPKQSQLKSRFRDYFPVLPYASTITEWGIVHLKTDAWHFTHMLSPLANVETVEELLAFPFPRFNEPWRFGRFKKGVEELHAAGLAVIGCINPGLSAQAEYMRGQEKYWLGLKLCPTFTAALLDRITDIRCEQARETARAGADVLFTSESIGTQSGLIISAEMWRTLYKARLKCVFQAAKEAKPDILIFMYADGKFEALIPDLVEIGVDILGPVSPEYIDPDQLKEKYGKALSFWGTISSQNLLPFGTPEDIRQEVKRRIRSVGSRGGLCIGPTHRVMPEVPWENLVALYEAVDMYGSYDHPPS